MLSWWSFVKVLAGWLADRFGGDRILSITTFFWSLITLLTPFLFHWAYHTAYPIPCLILLRVAMGLSQGGPSTEDSGCGEDVARH